MVLALLLRSSGNMSIKAVAVSDAALSAGSSPGIRSLSVFVACAIVRGSSSTIVRISSAYLRSVSVMVVGAGACADESIGTGLARFVAKELPSSSSTTGMWEGCHKVFPFGPCGFVDPSPKPPLLSSECPESALLA